MNRFILKEDPKKDFKGLPSWWSRNYEYTFAREYLGKGETIIDAGCGVEHPFKYAMAENNTVIAIDLDKRIEELNHDTIDFKVLDLSNLEGIKDKSIDKIFMIGTFEHIEYHKRPKVIEEFKRVLKDEGLLVCTITYPCVKPAYFQQVIRSVGGLSFDGLIDYDSKEGTLTGYYLDLRVFTAVIKKDITMKTKEEHKNKMLKPHKTK